LYSLDPFISSTVSKWSDKVSAASGVQLKAANKFRAVNQNTWAQIEATIKADGERLIERTRKLKVSVIYRLLSPRTFAYEEDRKRMARNRTRILKSLMTRTSTRAC
jgi:hypothetical protein